MVNIDNTKLDKNFNEIKDYLNYYELYGAPLVDEYSKELDEKISSIKTYMESLKLYNMEPDISSFQRICLDLSSTIYYCNDRLEKLNLLSDMSKIKYKDKYNTAYLNKQGSTEPGKKYTVEQLKAFADTEALEENLINFIYSRAAAVLKGKLDSANDLLKVCSKILSSLIQELNTFGVQGKYQE